MKLIMTLLLRNEEDVLVENLEYHLNQGVDFIIATNNRSVDGTEDILRDYESRGMLHYLTESGDTHSQGKWVTKMARLAASEFDADWVINNDADEFWWPTYHSNLKDAFSALSQQYNIVEAKRSNFVFLNINRQNGSFYERMIYRESESLNSLGKPLPPKQAHIASVVAEGNHSVSGLGEQNIGCNTLEIFHFPIRSYEQFTRKIQNGGAALERNTEVSPNTGSTWRSLYKQLQDNGNLNNYLNSQFYDSDKLSQQLSRGEIVEDTRLKDYLDKVMQLRDA